MYWREKGRKKIKKDEQDLMYKLHCTLVGCWGASKSLGGRTQGSCEVKRLGDSGLLKKGETNRPLQFFHNRPGSHKGGLGGETKNEGKAIFVVRPNSWQGKTQSQESTGGKKKKTKFSKERDSRNEIRVGISEKWGGTGKKGPATGDKQNTRLK